MDRYRTSVVVNGRGAVAPCVHRLAGVDMMVRFVKRAVLIAAAAGACYGLAWQFGARPAALIWAGVTAVACGLGAVFLRTSKIGQVTWRNHAAGYLIPWGWRLNKGRLWPIPIISWSVWMAVGATAILLRPEQTAEPPAVAVRLGLFAAWVVDGAALMFIAGSIRQATPGGSVGSLWKLVAVITGLMVTSAGLFLGGLTGTALLVAGGPPAVIAGCAALVVAYVLTLGRNTRWN